MSFVNGLGIDGFCVFMFDIYVKKITVKCGNVSFNFLLYGCYFYGQNIFKIAWHLKISMKPSLSTPISLYSCCCQKATLLFYSTTTEIQQILDGNHLFRHNFLNTSNNVINRSPIAWKQMNFVNFFKKIVLVTHLFYQL